MDLSIVVINYNTTEFLLRCLDNLSIACKRLDYEIFIVDNASPEGFPENLPLGDKRLHVIKNNINVGFAKANNQALRECKGNFILLLNPDVEVSKNTIREMVKFLKKQKTAGAVGCKTYWDHSVKLQFSTLKIPDLTTAFFENTVLGKLFPNNRYFGNQWEIDYMAWTTSKPFPVDGLPAAIFMIKKEVLRKVNYFDENFFLYYEDRDLCKRIQEERYEIYFLPHVEAIHHYGQSTIKENSF
ncbi:glycosyltransferase family 2 protein, partial [bacterium]|nr:glycosyltransferase family 2 protein [bacterium]